MFQCGPPCTHATHSNDIYSSPRGPSERASHFQCHLDVVLQVIHINSANYTAWETRWRCLEGLPDLFLQKEAVFLDEMLDLNPKNYQLWNYRRRFALKRGKVFEAEVSLLLPCSCMPRCDMPKNASCIHCSCQGVLAMSCTIGHIKAATLAGIVW